MKKRLCLALTIGTMALCLAACGDDKAKTTEEKTTAVAKAETEEKTTEKK